MLPRIVGQFLMSELQERAKKEANVKGEVYDENATKKSLDKSLASHLKNARQAHRPDIIKDMKVFRKVIQVIDIP